MRCRLCSNRAISHKADFVVSSGAQNFSNLPNYGVSTVSLFECLQCGLIQTDDAPIQYASSSTSTQSTFETIRKERVWQLNEGRMWWKKYSANADKKLSVLDIGCGKGEFLQFVVDEGSIGTGIEPSKYNRNVAKRTGLNVFPNRAKLIREDNKFDLIFSFHVLEHVTDIKKFLLQTKSFFGNNSIGCIEVPAFEASLEKSRSSDFVIDHLSYFSLNTLRLALEISGFEVLSSSRRMNGEHVVAFFTRRASANLHFLTLELKSQVFEFTVFLAANAHKTIGFWGASNQLFSFLANIEALSQNIRIFDSSVEKVGKFGPSSTIRVEHKEEFFTNPTNIVFISAPRFEDEIMAEIRLKINNKVEFYRSNFQKFLICEII